MVSTCIDTIDIPRCILFYSKSAIDSVIKHDAFLVIISLLLSAAVSSIVELLSNLRISKTNHQIKLQINQKGTRINQNERTKL